VLRLSDVLPVSGGSDAPQPWHVHAQVRPGYASIRFRLPPPPPFPHSASPGRLTASKKQTPSQTNKQTNKQTGASSAGQRRVTLKLRTKRCSNSLQPRVSSRRSTRANATRRNSHKRNEPVHTQAKQTASNVRGCAHRRQLRFVHGTHADASTSRPSSRHARTHQRVSDCCRLGDTAGAVDAFLRSIEVRDVLLRRLLRACWSLQPALHIAQPHLHMDGSHSGHTGTGTRLIPRHIGAGASVQPREWGLSCGVDAARSFGFRSFRKLRRFRKFASFRGSIWLGS
jgi:hypothetical protein